MYIMDFIHTHCSKSVVDWFSLVTHMHIVTPSLEIQTFKHLSWPIVSVNFNITMLHFVLFLNVTCYINYLLSQIYIITKEITL